MKILQNYRSGGKKNPIKKRAKDVKSILTEDIQMANKQIKRYSISSDIQFSSFQSLSRVQLFATLSTATHQAPCPSPTPGVYSNPCPLSR